MKKFSTFHTRTTLYYTIFDLFHSKKKEGIDFFNFIFLADRPPAFFSEILLPSLPFCLFSFL